GYVGPSGGGRVMGGLSEHNCHGWLEGYTLTGRHGLFATYEAFAMVNASQTVQHGKWLQEAKNLPWGAAVPSLNVLHRNEDGRMPMVRRRFGWVRRAHGARRGGRTM